MTKPAFPVYQMNDPLPSPRPMGNDILDFIASRRSTPIKTFDMEASGPDLDTLQSMIRTAMRVPDHRKLGPWRALIIDGDDRITLSDRLVARYLQLNPDASASEIAEEKARLFRAPTCVIIVSSPVDDGKTPVWEQELSAGALCMNFLYVLHAAGYAASWLSEWWAFDREIAGFLGLTADERIAGNIFIGQSKVALFERPRPDFNDRISVWKPES